MGNEDLGEKRTSLKGLWGSVSQSLVFLCQLRLLVPVPKCPSFLKVPVNCRITPVHAQAPVSASTGSCTVPMEREEQASPTCPCGFGQTVGTGNAELSHWARRSRSGPTELRWCLYPLAAKPPFSLWLEAACSFQLAGSLLCFVVELSFLE